MPKKILVVDDNETFGRLIERFLISNGFFVRFEACPLKGLATAADFAPELALIDFNMPELNGYELARRLMRLPGLDRLSFICLSGSPGLAADKMADIGPNCKVHNKIIKLEELLLDIKRMTGLL